MINITLPFVWKLGNDTSICYGDTIEWEVSRYDSSIIIYLAQGDTLNKTLLLFDTTFVSISPTTSTPYIFIGIDTSINKNCKILDTIWVFVNPPVNAAFSINDTMCVSNEINFIDKSIGNIVQWNWKYGDGNQDNIVNPKHSFTDSGQYQVYLKVIDNIGCLDSTEGLIKIHSNPKINLGNDKRICEGDSVNLDAGFGFAYYKWSTGQNTQVIEVDSSIIVSVLVIDTNACKTLDSIYIKLNLNPFANIKANNVTPCFGEIINISADEHSQYLWSTSATTQSILVDTSGNYWVQVIDSNNCTSTIDSISIVFNNCDSVWPGDCNSNKSVRWDDLFVIGRYFNQTGFARADQTTDWRAHYAEDWYSAINNGKDLKHVDCNGDGNINRKDVDAVKANYKQAHAKSYSHQNQPNNPDLYFDVLSDDVAPGTAVEVAIMIGRDTASATVYGAGFEININKLLIQKNSLDIDFSKGIFLKDTNNLYIIVGKDTVSNAIIGAVTRTDTIDIVGFGEIARLKFIIDSNATIGDELGLKIINSGGTVSNGDSTDYNHPAGGESDTTLVINPGTGINPDLQFKIYDLRIIPNPYKDYTTISYHLYKASNVKLEVHNLLGKKITTLTDGKQNSGYHSLNFSAKNYSYPSGIYLLKLKVEGEESYRKLVEY